MTQRKKPPAGTVKRQPDGRCVAERGREGVAARGVGEAQGRDVGVVHAGLEQRGDHVRRELADAAAALEHAGGGQALAQVRRGVDPAQAQPRRE